MDQIIQRIFDFFLFGGKDFALFIISMIPFIELRGSIIFGAAMGIPWQHTFLVSFLGNILPVPFLILLARPIFAWLKTTRLLAGFTQKVEDRLMKKADKVTVQKYSAVGLFLFVAIPLPGTGAWTGTLAASLRDMDFRKSVRACMGGVLLAGCIMGALSLLGVSAFGAISK